MKLILVTVATLAVSGAAVARPAHDMAAMSAADHTTMASGAQGVGVIKKLDAKTGSVTLQHGPIAALNWPAMTMPFKIDPKLLQGMKVGQKVSFTVKSGAPPEIVAIKSAG